MKKICLLLVLFLPLVVFSQNNTSSSDYAEIVFNGEPAFINVTTGDIVSEIPNSFTKKATISATATTNTATNSGTHSIQKGETLYSISKKYNTSIATLKALNPNISLDILSVNQEIVVSQTNKAESAITTANGSDANNYEVKKGDTLYSISKMFNISVNELKNTNNLTSDMLSIGQILLVK